MINPIQSAHRNIFHLAEEASDKLKKSNIKKLIILTVLLLLIPISLNADFSIFLRSIKKIVFRCPSISCAFPIMYHNGKDVR